MPEPVIFWDEIYSLVQEAYLDWHILKGETVVHRELGTGQVIAIKDSQCLVVDYDEANVIEHKITPELRTVFYPFRVSEHLLGLRPRIVQDLQLRRRNAKQLKLEHERNLRQEAERRHEQRLKAKIEPFIRLSQHILRHRIDSSVEHPVLTQLDIELAFQWNKESVRLLCMNKMDDLVKELTEGKFSKDPELGRLLSARAAEIAAMTLFREYGFTVEDVSAYQVTNPQNRDWVTHDFKMDDHPIDVKNSRRSEQNENTYVEHCIPEFKRDRQGKDVTLVGVLSHCLWPCSILNPSKSSRDISILVLGETDWRKLSELKKFFEQSGLLEISLPSLTSRAISFLPAWVFEFDRSFYEKRDNLISKAKETDIPSFDLRERWQKRRIGTKDGEESMLPILIAAGRNLHENWGKESLQGWEWTFIEQINTWREKIGLSLPFLFCSVLVHFLEIMASDLVPPYYSPAEYRRLLFFDNKNLSMPLFVFDPLQTIDTLITTLTTLWTTNREIIKDFRAFRLQGLNILQGKHSETDPQWKTLVAYCGGRREDKRKCGFSPLVLGDSVDSKLVKSCPFCGKLICPKCDFCMNNCKRWLSLRRQAPNA